jgi:predicted phage tail protein
VAGAAALLGASAFGIPVSLAASATAPSAPTGLTAVPGNKTIALSWSAPADGGSPILGYNLYQGTTSGGESGTPVNGATLIAVSSTTVTGLTNAKTYYYVVKAVNAIGASVASNESWAVPAATVPGPPTGVTASAGNEAANVTWTAASAGGANITRYTVLATDATTPAKGGQSCVWTTGPLSCVVTGLNNGDSYSFTVTATNALGNGVASSPSTPSVVPTITVATAPAGVVATPGNTTIALSWVAPDNGGSAITGYNLYDSTTSGDENYAAPVNGATLISGTSTTVTGLVNDKEYYFTLKAVNGVGASLPSSEVWAIPAGIVPSAPRALSAKRGYGSAVVTWTAPSSSGGSAVDRYSLAAADSTASTRGGQSCIWTTGPLTCAFTGLTDGDSYTFTAVAANSVGNSVASAASNAVVPAVSAPVAPSGLSAIPGNTTISLSWVAPVDNGSAIVGYNLYEGTTSGGESGTPVNGSVLISGTEVTVSSLTNGHTYYFTAKAVNAAGTSAASNESWAIPAPTVPGSPMLVTATPSGIGGVVVSWSAPASPGGSAINSYAVTPYLDGVSQGSHTFAPPATSELITGLKPGGAYSFTVSAINATGPGAASLPSSVTTLLRAPSAIALQLSRASVTYGNEQTEHFSVVVSPKYSTTTPTGTVEVKKSTTILCFIKLSSGKGSCTTLRTRLHAGRYSIYATYPRNLSFVGSTAAAKTLTVAKATTSTSLKLSETKVTFGHEQSERFSVTVSPQYSGTAPTGVVTISGPDCLIKLSSGKGSCTAKASSLRIGTRHPSATYWGSASFLGSSSSKKVLTVLK